MPPEERQALVHEAHRLRSRNGLARLWFQKTREAIAFSFGTDADEFARLLAATSPISTIESNVTKACQAYRQLHTEGLHRGSFIKIHWMMIHAILYDEPLVSRKVWALYQNLAGNEQVCPIDRWMLRWGGYDPLKVWVNRQRYNELESRIIAEAQARGISPAERQVEIWVAQRGDATSYGDIIRRRGIHRAHLLRRLI